MNQQDHSQDKAPLTEDLKKKKILIVEDEEDAATIFKTLIESEGYQKVDYALNGQIALDMQKTEKYDLILLDIIMPVMDGIEALQRIREGSDIYGNPKIIMLTNLTGEMAEESVRKYNIDGFIVKIESEPETLLAHIKEALSR